MIANETIQFSELDQLPNLEWFVHVVYLITKQTIITIYILIYRYFAFLRLLSWNATGKTANLISHTLFNSLTGYCN